MGNDKNIPGSCPPLTTSPFIHVQNHRQRFVLNQTGKVMTNDQKLIKTHYMDYNNKKNCPLDVVCPYLDLINYIKKR